MKKLFLIFTVLFTCALPVSGFGDIITNKRDTFNDLTQGFSNKFTQFQTESQDKVQQLRSEQQDKMEKMRREQQEKMDQLKQKYDTKLNELKEKAPEAFRDIELSFAEYIRNTPFENCDLGYSSIKCYKDNNKTYSAWACTLKPGITKEKMNQDVQKHCSTIRQELEFKPDIPETTNANDTETDEENDTPIRMNAQVEELSPEDEVTAHAEHNENADFDFMAAQKQEQETKDWNTNYEDSDKTPDSAPAPTQDKSASAMIAQDAARKAEQNKQKCTLAQRNKINATDCKISADGKYSDIVCKNGYTKNADGTKCEKSDTPDKKAKPELIKISGIVIDATSANEQTIGGVRIKYDEGKKDNDGNKKYAQHQTGNNGRFAINIVPGSTITFTHKMYQDITTTYSVATKNVKIKMSPTDATVNDRRLQELCETDNKGTWNKTKKECNCKDKTAIFDETKGCVPPKNLQRGGNVIDEKGNPMPNVTIKYGNKKIQTDKDGRFDITAPKGTVITLSAKGYEDIKITLDEACPNCDIDMEPTDKAANNAKKKELCETDNKGTWIKTSGKCNCKDKTAIFDETKGCVPPKNLQRGGNVIDEKGNPMPNVSIWYNNNKAQTDENGRFDITAPKGTTIIFTAKGYKDIKETLDEACPNCDIDMEPTDKAANNAKKKELCEKDGPNQGKWNETLKTCKCKGKAFFDEDEGCVESTQEYTNTESALETLYEQFKEQLETIKKSSAEQ